MRHLLLSIVLLIPSTYAVAEDWQTSITVDIDAQPSIWGNRPQRIQTVSVGDVILVELFDDAAHKLFDYARKYQPECRLPDYVTVACTVDSIRDDKLISVSGFTTTTHSFERILNAPPRVMTIALTLDKKELSGKSAFRDTPKTIFNLPDELHHLYCSIRTSDAFDLKLWEQVDKAPESAVVETAEKPLSKAKREALESTKAKSIEELSARLQQLEGRIEKLEGKAKGRKSRRKSGQPPTTKTLPPSLPEGARPPKQELDGARVELRL